MLQAEVMRPKFCKPASLRGDSGRSVTKETCLCGCCWALGRTYRMVARTDEELTEGDSLLATASEQDKRGIYPAIHRDIAYAMASQSEDYAAATEHLRKYVDGHIAVHGGLPLDIDDVYDKMVLFGDNEWMPASAQKAGSAQTIGMSQDVDRRITAHRKAGRLPFAQLGDPASAPRPQGFTSRSSSTE